MPQKVKPGDFKDPFNAGQMMGMVTALMFIEQHGGIDNELLQKVKYTCATNMEEYIDSPAEDILMMLDIIVKEMETL